MKNILRPTKRYILSLLGQDFFVKPDCECSPEHFGSTYGGWNVATRDLSINSIVYSFGIGEDVSFDLALIQRFEMDVYAFDPTPKSIAWMKQQCLPAQFKVFEYGLADFDGDVNFNPPENASHVSYTMLDRPATTAHQFSAPVKRLSTIMNILGHRQIDLLKMDIEGAEYSALDDILKSNIRPRQLLVEFHHRFPGVGIRKSQDAISKLKASGYLLFSVSKSGEEYCFIYGSH